MIDSNTILNNISKYRQYYLLDQLDLDIKQVVQLYLSHTHEFRIEEFIIIKNRILNVDSILLDRIRKEVYRNNFSWNQWDIISVEGYIDELIIDYNKFLSIKQTTEYNWDNKRIGRRYDPSRNMLLGCKNQSVCKLCLIHNCLEKNNIPMRYKTHNISQIFNIM